MTAPSSAGRLTYHTFDQDYVRRLAAGDPIVEDHFSGYFGELLFLKLRVRLRSPQLIDDVRQETLLRVLQTIRNKAGVEFPERLGAFVCAVCNNVMMEFMRSETRHGQMDETSTDPVDERIDLEGPLIAAQRKKQVENILSELSKKDRDLLRMHFLEEKDKGELCRRFNVSEEYLRVLLHRAKSRFRSTYGRRITAPI
jgi:RNA polymerase sigma-70 factor (ECF subfamily)